MHGGAAGSGAPKGNTNARKDAVSAHKRLIAKYGRPTKIDLTQMDFGDAGLDALLGDPALELGASLLEERMMEDRRFYEQVADLEAELTGCARRQASRYRQLARGECER